MRNYILILFPFICFISLTIPVYSQDYIGDTLALRAILDLNGLDTIPVQSVSDSLNGRIRNLYLINKNLTTLPPEIGVLTYVEDLWLYGNSLTSLPSEIGNLSNLMLLNLESNGLSTIPPEIGNLAGLTVLELGFNNLSNLPQEIGRLYNLVVFKANDNNLTVLPSSVGGLMSLNHLNLFNNKLTTLPDSIVNLVTWDTLDLDSNYLTPSNLTDSIVFWLDTYHPDWREHQNTPIVYQPVFQRITNQNKTYAIIMNNFIGYHLTSSGKIRLDVLDPKGRVISILANGRVRKGYHSVYWQRNDYSAGVYLIRLLTAGSTNITKTVLIR